MPNIKTIDQITDTDRKKLCPVERDGTIGYCPCCQFYQEHHCCNGHRPYCLLEGGDEGDGASDTLVVDMDDLKIVHE
jgi:hypothetical protein